MPQPTPYASQYSELLLSVKHHIRSAQAKAALAVNAGLIQLYWNTGKMIADNQALFLGRNSYVAQLEKDLKAEFPDMTGFSRANLFSIRKFYKFYSDNFSVQQLVGLSEDLKAPGRKLVTEWTEISVQQPVTLSHPLFSIPWGHHVVIINKAKALDEALFYVQKTVEHNWSRNILILQIEQNLYNRQGKAVTNFACTLPEQQAGMAQQILKDPYNFSFLTLEANVQEVNLEKQLTEQITKFLLELGKGFAFIGRQYPIQLGNKDYRFDLLFYHIKLRCFVIIDLKTGAFEPEFAGKMNFYLNMADDQLKSTDDQPSIGIILCKTKSGLEVEYALRGLQKPIGVSEFLLTDALPVELKSSMPTVDEFEQELQKSGQQDWK